MQETRVPSDDPIAAGADGSPTPPTRPEPPRRKVAVIVVAVLVVLVGGVAGAVTFLDHRSSSYSDLLELRDAAVDAGLNCSKWERNDIPEREIQAGVCTGGDGGMLLMYTDSAKRTDDVAEMRTRLAAKGTNYTLLVRDNWVIATPTGTAADLADDMGGEVLQDSN